MNTIYVVTTRANVNSQKDMKAFCLDIAEKSTFLANDIDRVAVYVNSTCPPNVTYVFADGESNAVKGGVLVYSYMLPLIVCGVEFRPEARGFEAEVRGTILRLREDEGGCWCEVWNARDGNEVCSSGIFDVREEAVLDAAAVAARLAGQLDLVATKIMGEK